MPFVREYWYLIAALSALGIIIAVNFARGRWESAVGSLAILAFIIVSNWLILRWATGGKTIDDAVEEGVDFVASNELTQSMIGQWGYRDEVVLIVSEIASQVKFSVPENGTWRTFISDAEIVDDTVRFIQKSYLLDGTAHTFNGVACNSIAKLVDDQTLEYGLTSKDSPEYSGDLLKRID